MATERRIVRSDRKPSIDTRVGAGIETPLKNKRRGERPVALSPEVATVVKTYLSEYRYDVNDDHGRQPLLASATGRPVTPPDSDRDDHMAAQSRVATAECCRAGQCRGQDDRGPLDKATPEERRERLRERMEDRRRSLIDQLEFQNNDN